MNHPVIACDMDEVVADLLTGWLHLYNLKWGDTLTKEEITDWDVRKFVRKECGSKAYDILRDPKLYPFNVEPIEGAKAGILRLRSMGYRVVFVTSCVVGSVDAKMGWLAHHRLIDRGATPKDFIAAKDKALINAELLIDDGPHNIAAFPRHTILFSQPYNEHLDHPYRARSWAEIPQMVASLVPCPVA